MIRAVLPRWMMFNGCQPVILMAVSVAAVFAPAPSVAFGNVSAMKCSESEFGKTADGKSIRLFTLENGKGVVARISSYGATVVGLETPDRDGRSANIVLGHSSVQQWLENSPYFGCTVGRYGNRIAKGIFTLNGNVYTLAKNNGENHLHGGKHGFHRALWDGSSATDDTTASVTFTYTSPDGEDGYPGNLKTTVRYVLTADNELRIEYSATTDKPTVVNLTNHCYWNLTGDAETNDILSHRLRLNCDRYLPVSESLIPTGDIQAVAESPMDFTTFHEIGERIEKVEGGYDHCYVINKSEEQPALAARVEEPASGRVMEVLTTEPGIQFYSGNFLSGEDDCGGFSKHHGFCLETQHFPDSPNQLHFPTTQLNPGETYSSTTIHRFSVLEKAAE